MAASFVSTRYPYGPQLHPNRILAWHRTSKTCPFLILTLRTIKSITHLLFNSFAATHHASRSTESYKLIIKPRTWFSEIRIHVLSRKDKLKVAICIREHSTCILPIEDGSCRSILRPVIELHCCNVGIRRGDTEGDLLAKLASQSKSICRTCHVHEPACT